MLSVCELFFSKRRFQHIGSVALMAEVEFVPVQVKKLNLGTELQHYMG